MPLCQAMKCSTKSSRGFWPLFLLKWILDRMTNSLIGLCHFRTTLLPYSLYVWSNTGVKSISCPSFQNALEMPNFWQPWVGENTTILKLVSFVWKLIGGISILMGTEIAKNILKIKVSTTNEGIYCDISSGTVTFWNVIALATKMGKWLVEHDMIKLALILCIKENWSFWSL